MCLNVGTLKAGMTYQVGVKVSMPYNATASWSVSPAPMGPEFGKMMLESYNPNSQAYDAVPLINLTRDPNALWVT